MKTLLLPGMDGTGSLFARFSNALPPELEPRTVSYPSDIPLSYAQLCESITVPDEPFAIVAESFSGPLAVLLAARYADRVSALVLVASFARNPAPVATWLAAMIGPTLFRLPMLGFVMRRMLLGRDASLDDVKALRRLLRSISPLVMAARIREIRRIDVRATFAKLATPALYVSGRRDRLISKKAASLLKRLRPDLHCEELDTPHLVLQRDPVGAAQVIGPFLRDHATKHTSR